MLDKFGLVIIFEFFICIYYYVFMFKYVVLFFKRVLLVEIKYFNIEVNEGYFIFKFWYKVGIDLIFY